MAHDHEKSVRIFTLEKEHEYLIPMLEDAFNKAGIDFHLRSKYDTAYDGVFIGQKGVGDLYVFENDRKRAEEIVRHILMDRGT